MVLHNENAAGHAGGQHMTRNTRASLQMRARGNPMSACDRLPPELRRWFAGAALPWSARLTLRIWHRALRGDGSPEAAVARLLPPEVTMVTRDAARILGATNPSRRSSSSSQSP
ncbi:hypothetical protein SDC9_52152 [bioreactor metagenome]|uniref:Uncharacterized protein n=1 Tax=bioreactor metagenome TaxID=1076179 RepID=A0A644WQD4_9ZZZZ